jgi:hypothetical protein
VNNAGISYDSTARGVDVDLRSVHVAMETNLFGNLALDSAFSALSPQERVPSNRERFERTKAAPLRAWARALQRIRPLRLR